MELELEEVVWVVLVGEHVVLSVDFGVEFVVVVVVVVVGVVEVELFVCNCDCVNCLVLSLFHGFLDAVTRIDDDAAGADIRSMD